MNTMDLDEEKSMNVNRKLNVYKHIKKKAANDAQLLMNRIALIQKEEERARKKIDQTKEKANEILELRNETEKRAKEYSVAHNKLAQIQQVRQAKNREQDGEGRKARIEKLNAVRNKKLEDVKEIHAERKHLAQLVEREREKEFKLKQEKRLIIKRQEEDSKRKKDREREEKEKKIKEIYEQKLKEESLEAKRAEKLVKALEKKEKDWIEKLRKAQVFQESAFEQLEMALVKDNGNAISSNHKLSNSDVSREKSSQDRVRSMKGPATNGEVSGKKNIKKALS